MKNILLFGLFCFLLVSCSNFRKANQNERTESPKNKGVFQTLESQLDLINAESISLDSAKLSQKDTLIKKAIPENLKIWNQVKPLSENIREYLVNERASLKKQGGIYDGRPSKMYDQLFDYQVRTEGFIKAKGLKLKSAPLNETREDFYKKLDQMTYQQALLYLERLIISVKQNDVAILEGLNKPAN